MIITVTMNPSVDIGYELKSLMIDTTNRVGEVSKTAGGKGLNVARVIKQAGRKSAGTGIIGGHLGEFIAQKLDEEGIVNQFLQLEKESRNCIAILHDDGHQTEILEAGPTFNRAEEQAFIDKFQEVLNDYDTVTISGSLPKGLAANFYQRMISVINLKDKKALFDASGEPLKEVLNGVEKPALLKINLDELNDILDDPISGDWLSIKGALNSEMFAGIKAIVITEGSAGAKVKWEEEFYDLTIPTVEAINPVGSGDATLAGFAIGLDENKTVEETLKLGMAFGVLNAMEPKTGHINLDNLETIEQQIKVEKA